MTHVTCKLTAKNRGQLRNPTLGNRVWATFTFSMRYGLLSKFSNHFSVITFGSSWWYWCGAQRSMSTSREMSNDVKRLLRPKTSEETDQDHVKRLNENTPTANRLLPTQPVNLADTQTHRRRYTPQLSLVPVCQPSRHTDTQT